MFFPFFLLAFKSCCKSVSTLNHIIALAIFQLNKPFFNHHFERFNFKNHFDYVLWMPKYTACVYWMAFTKLHSENWYIGLYARDTMFAYFGPKTHTLADLSQHFNWKCSIKCQYVQIWGWRLWWLTPWHWIPLFKNCVVNSRNINDINIYDERTSWSYKRNRRTSNSFY